jgi:phage shock protein C
MQPKQLTRSETDKKLAGVCGGLAVYFNIDATLVRVGMVVAALMGWGVVLYLILWIVLPSEGDASIAERNFGTNSALSIAEERFAKGEITAEELARIREDLKGQAS